MIIEPTILETIANKYNKQKDIAVVYACLIIADIDFKIVNEEILKRYKVSGLIRIKDMAWKHLEKNNITTNQQTT